MKTPSGVSVGKIKQGHINFKDKNRRVYCICRGREDGVSFSVSCRIICHGTEGCLLPYTLEVHDGGHHCTRSTIRQKKNDIPYVPKVRSIYILYQSNNAYTKTNEKGKDMKIDGNW